MKKIFMYLYLFKFLQKLFYSRNIAPQQTENLRYICLEYYCKYVNASILIQLGLIKSILLATEDSIYHSRNSRHYNYEKW